MRKTSRFRLSSLILLPLAGWAAEIPQGAHVLLRMVNSVSTRTAQAGDTVYMQTATPIQAEGRIVVPVGSYVSGVVSDARRSGRVSGRAELGIHIDSLTFPSGQIVKISPHLSSVDSDETDQKVPTNENQIKQGASKMQDAARIAILGGTGAGIGGIADRSWTGAGIGAGAGSAVGLATVLMTRGKEVELKPGSTFDVVFDRPVSIQ